jgi:hypothetical protein
MSFGVTPEIALQYWAQLDCPTSLRLALLARNGEWAEVLAVTASPENFPDDPLGYAKANAAVCFLKKNPAVPGSTEEARRSAALAAWRDGEASCYTANERLSPYLVSPLSGDAPAEFLRRVRRRLLSWLRHAPDDDELKKRARHGPGTTFSSQVANPTAADKYSEVMSLTSNAVVHMLNLAGTKWMGLTSSKFRESLDDCIEVTRGNRHAVVPKTALTHRNIAIEPTLNIYFQLAVGNAMRSRMRKYAGWDLDNAASIHREMARRGSVDGSFATIDLSNASDSLCKNLVRILLRDDNESGSPRAGSWLSVMEDLRSPRTRVDGRWHLLEKFSSMGNGYTFELESCVFAAIAAECLVLRGHEPVLGHNLFVFGDDIIVPADTFKLVVDTLQWCGFKANSKKTYGTGPFRESCGGDFFSGVPVRGYYFEDALSGVNLDRVYSLHNGVYACLKRCGIDPAPFCGWLRRHYLPSRFRDIGGPDRLGDTVLHGVAPRHKWRHCIRWVRVVRWSRPTLVRWSYFSEEARLACRLTGYGDTFGINSRGSRPIAETDWVSDS